MLIKFRVPKQHVLVDEKEGTVSLNVNGMEILMYSDIVDEGETYLIFISSTKSPGKNWKPYIVSV